jgi:hypothetical protein
MSVVGKFPFLVLMGFQFSKSCLLSLLPPSTPSSSLSKQFYECKNFTRHDYLFSSLNLTSSYGRYKNLPPISNYNCNLWRIGPCIFWPAVPTERKRKVPAFSTQWSCHLCLYEETPS